MRYNLGKIAVIYIIIFGILGCENASSPSSSVEIDKRPIVCFGDSLTEGYGASKPGQIDKSKSYPAFLQEKIRVDVINVGISGDRASGGLARMDSDVLAKDPQMVILLLGGNDFLGRRSANEAKDDLQAIIDKAKNQNIKIYLASFIGDSTWEESYLQYSQLLPGASISELRSLLADYKRVYAELSSENKDIEYIGNIWRGIGILQMSDPIHPNAEGYRIMADNIFAEIRPYLKEKNLLN